MPPECYSTRKAKPGVYLLHRSDSLTLGRQGVHSNGGGGAPDTGTVPVHPAVRNHQALLYEAVSSRICHSLPLRFPLQGAKEYTTTVVEVQ